MTMLEVLRERKYYVVSAFVALMIVLGLAGSFGSTEARELELTAGGGSVPGKCMILGPRHVVCVPAKTPKGSPLVKMWEDGSARYANGSEYGSNGKF